MTGNARNACAFVLILPLLIGCGGGDDSPATAQNDPDPYPQAPAANTAAVDDTKVDSPQQSIEGSVRFTLDGESKTLAFVPWGRAFYTSMASQVTFHASADSQESLMLNIMNADLKDLDYPIVLPLPRDPGQPVTMANRGATVGWAYMNADGEEWTNATAKLQLDGLSRDGVLTGRFEREVLTGSGKPDITLEDGEFSVRLTSPW